MVRTLAPQANTDTSETDESGSGALWSSSLSLVEPTGRKRHEVLIVFALSLAAHALFARAFGEAQNRPLAVSPRIERVQVQFSRPPPPPPTLPKEPPPPPPKPVVVKKAAPAPTPAAPPPIIQNETRKDVGIDAPEGEDGELPKGTGEIGTAPPPPPPAPVRVAPPAPAPVVAAREGANYARNPRPPYPQLAARKGWEGVTTLRIQVLANGRPGTISVHTSSGRDVLDEAATEAVKSWTFVPATQGGQPIAGWVNVPIVFRLQ